MITPTQTRQGVIKNDSIPYRLQNSKPAHIALPLDHLQEGDGGQLSQKNFFIKSLRKMGITRGK